MPWIALSYGWQWAFLLTGAFGFIWLFFWFWLYDDPGEATRGCRSAELAYIESDPPSPQVAMPWLSLARYRQTWAFAVGKFMTDPVWWFYLYWVPELPERAARASRSQMGPPLVAIYLIADVGASAGAGSPRG